MPLNPDVIQVDKLADGFYALHDPLDFRCYLLVGTREAALVDTMGGFGNVREVAQRMAGGLPVRALLTHKHIDHAAGAFWFDEVGVPEHEDIEWDTMPADAEKYLADAVEGGLVSADVPVATRAGAKPRPVTVRERDVIDLGGLRLEAVALPGHTKGSMGYLCPELDILLSGDAVTPIMCLCFVDSLPINEWQQTLTKMEGLPFSLFYTGHHKAPFTKDDLPGWRAAGDFAKTDRGFEWHHMLIEGWEGTCHLCPCPTYDADSRDFRAVITQGLPPKRPRRRKNAEE